MADPKVHLDGNATQLGGLSCHRQGGDTVSIVTCVLETNILSNIAHSARMYLRLKWEHRCRRRLVAVKSKHEHQRENVSEWSLRH